MKKCNNRKSSYPGKQSNCNDDVNVNVNFVCFDLMSLTELLCLGVRGEAQENESASLPNTERTEELGGATSTRRGRQMKDVVTNLVPGEKLWERGCIVLLIYTTR